MRIGIRIFIGDTSNDIHSAGPVVWELVPSSHQRGKPSHTILCTFSRGNNRIWTGIPISDSLREEWALIDIYKGSFTDKCPDIFGMCETFLERSIPDCQLVIDGFNLLRKDRSDTQNKSGGGLVLYYRKSLSCRRRIDLEISKIETLWT